MIVKKLAVAAASAALVLGTIVPAFAETNVSNLGVVVNGVLTTSDTGNNSLNGDFVDGGSVTTGNAISVAQVENILNTTSVDSKSFFGSDVTVNNAGLVLNLVGISASTGKNTVNAGEVDGGSVQTGNAGAESVVSNVVNTTVVKTTDLGEGN